MFDYRYKVRPIYPDGSSIRNYLMSEALIASFRLSKSVVDNLKGVLTKALHPSLFVKDNKALKKSLLNIGNFSLSTRPSPHPKTKPISLYIVDEGLAGKGNPYIKLDFIPNSLTYSPSSEFSSIGVVGVNNPSYHYGGSEDTLRFEVDWFGYKEESVIEKCRKVEALTKADGFIHPPRIIQIYWGDFNVMFKYHFFILISAEYKMKTFMRNHLSYSNGAIISTPNNFQPIEAVQTLIFKRVSDHSLRWSEML